MEALRFIRGISAPLIAFGLDNRQLHHPPLVHLASIAPQDATTVVNERARRGNWVMKILRVGSFWVDRRKEDPTGYKKEEEIEDEEDRCVGCGGDDGIDECSVMEAGEGDAVEFDRESFKRFLRRVSLAEAELYAKLTYLGKLAYSIHRIKPVSLLNYHGLQYVTSSLEKKSLLSNADGSTLDQDKSPDEPTPKREGNKIQSENGAGISASVAYRIAASAAAYLQSQTKNILPLRTQKAMNEDDPSISTSSNEAAVVTSSQVASFVATTNSVTAVIAGKEKTKDAVAKDLNSARFSPCDWFICDDDKSGTRYFIIQGSESLASWQANLLFEPIQFECYQKGYAPSRRYG